MHDDFKLETRHKLLPAWLLSVGVHVVLMIFLSIFAIGNSNTPATDEVVRPVGIVLGRKTANADRDYFDEATEKATAAESSADAAADARLPRSNPPASQLESLVMPGFALPDTFDIPLAGMTSADAPRLTVSDARPKLPGVDESAIIAEEQARFQAANARGPTTKLGIFGSKEAVGGSFVFLIDRSQSMGGGGLGVLQDAENELVHALAKLEDKHRFQVVVYHDKCVYLNRRELLPATDTNRAAVPGFLSTKAAFGATDHELALTSALSLEPDVIFLLTDGGEPPLKDHQIRAIAKFATPRTSIHCIHFGTGPLQNSNNFLARLAAATGGEYGYVDVNQHRK